MTFEHWRIWAIYNIDQCTTLCKPNVIYGYLVGRESWYRDTCYQPPISSPLCLLTSSSSPPNTWTNFYQHSGARWQTMPSFPSWSRWCSWPGCATPFLTSIRFVLHPGLQRNKKHKLIAACRTGYAMCAELRFPRSQPAEAVRTTCHSNVGFTSCWWHSFATLAMNANTIP